VGKNSGKVFLNAEEEEHKTANGMAPKTLKSIHSNFVPIPETVAVGCKVSIENSEQNL
jgi:hypothetical protein